MLISRAKAAEQPKSALAPSVRIKLTESRDSPHRTRERNPPTSDRLLCGRNAIEIWIGAAQFDIASRCSPTAPQRAWLSCDPLATGTLPAPAKENDERAAPRPIVARHDGGAAVGDALVRFIFTACRSSRRIAHQAKPRRNSRTDYARRRAPSFFEPRQMIIPHISSADWTVTRCADRAQVR